MEVLSILLICFLVIVAPVWILLHYATDWRCRCSITRNDEDVLIDIRRAADNMERRLGALATILDTETGPDTFKERNQS